jgi:hypothetical protein
VGRADRRPARRVARRPGGPADDGVVSRRHAPRVRGRVGDDRRLGAAACGSRRGRDARGVRVSVAARGRVARRRAERAAGVRACHSRPAR